MVDFLEGDYNSVFVLVFNTGVLLVVRGPIRFPSFWLFFLQMVKKPIVKFLDFDANRLN